MPKIAFIEITARPDYPYTNRPDLHLFEPTLECFKKQTMTDFEWIIIDALYEQRKNYFKGMKLPFKVKHVPAQPNYWLEHGFTGMSNQFNRGIIHADSECLFFTADGYMMQPVWMEQLWQHYKKGFFPLAWYFYDLSFDQDALSRQGLVPNIAPVPKVVFDPSKGLGDHSGFAATTHVRGTNDEAPYNYSGYTGKRVSVDFRYNETFNKNPKAVMCLAGWNWFYGTSTASMEAMLKINGFDEKFDSDKGVLDCDVGSRLQMAGYGYRFALFRDFYMVRAVVSRNWHPSIDVTKSVKCNYGLIELARHFKQVCANTHVITDQEIDWIKESYCPNECTNSKYCRENHQWQYPFEHKDGYNGEGKPTHNSKKEYWEMWREHQVVFNLEQEREKRIRGEKYREGTFT